MDDDTLRFQKVVADIAAERANQDDKFGQQDHNAPHWMMILQEEIGEFAEAWQNPVDRRARMREELVQVAAVAVAMLECFDRNGGL